MVFLQKTRDTPYEERRQILGISTDWQRSLAGDGDADGHHILLSALFLQVGPRTHRSRPETPCNSHIKSHINSLNPQCCWYKVMINVHNKSPLQPTINIPCVYGCFKWQGMKFSAWVICTLHRTSVLRFFLSLIIRRSLSANTAYPNVELHPRLPSPRPSGLTEFIGNTTGSMRKSELNPGLLLQPRCWPPRVQGEAKLALVTPAGSRDSRSSHLARCQRMPGNNSRGCQGALEGSRTPLELDTGCRSAVAN